MIMALGIRVQFEANSVDLCCAFPTRMLLCSNEGRCGGAINFTALIGRAWLCGRFRL